MGAIQRTALAFVRTSVIGSIATVSAIGIRDARIGFAGSNHIPRVDRFAVVSASVCTCVMATAIPPTILVTSIVA